MRAALRDEPVVVRAPEAVRPWQHVLGPLDGYLRVAETLLDGAAPHGLELRPRGRRPGRLGRAAGGRPLAGRAGRRARARRRGDRRGAAAAARRDAAPASELGWTPQWDLEAALDATVAWYGAYRAGADMRAETLAQIAAYRGG